MTPQEVREGLERCRRATPPPWYEDDGLPEPVIAPWLSPVEKDANVEFACYARAALPRALEHIQRLHELLERQNEIRCSRRVFLSKDMGGWHVRRDSSGEPSGDPFAADVLSDPHPSAADALAAAEEYLSGDEKGD